jgi:hypothetical protein
MQLTLDYQNMDASYKGKAKGNRKCLEQFDKFQVGTWAKTYANLLIGQEGWSSITCNLTWKLRSTKSHRFYFHLFPSYQHTESMLPTPCVGTHGRGGIPHKGVVNALLNGEKPKIQELLVDRVFAEELKKKGINYVETFRNFQMPICIESNAETNARKSHLSPEFVMEMMGFPTDWTLLPFLNKEICN